MEIREITSKKHLRKDLVEFLNRENTSVENKIVDLVMESLKQLSILKLALHNEELLKLEGYELDGVIRVIDEVDNLLNVAADIHMATA